MNFARQLTYSVSVTRILKPDWPLAVLRDLMRWQNTAPNQSAMAHTRSLTGTGMIASATSSTPLAMARRFCIATLVVVALAHAASAEPQRFSKVGDRLYFDSNVPFANDTSQSIGAADEDALLRYLNEDPAIRTVVLNSTGGSTETGRSMAHIIAKFGLDTEVVGRCLSACTLIFMGGTHRTLPKGSVLGFHRSYVEVINLGEAKKSKSLVADEYDRGVDETLANVTFLVERGVDIGFTLKALSYEPADMWLPSRAELTAAGVLTAP